jgi:putative transposase
MFRSRAAATQKHEGKPCPEHTPNSTTHITFSTKNRQQYIAATIEDELHKYIAGVIRGLEGACLEINGATDHVHILAILPPKIAVSNVLRVVKANSSKWIHEMKPELPSFAWQDGFSAFTVSKSQLGPVRRYIRNQKIHHRRVDFKEELVGLLEKHDVEFDDRYIWD